MKTLKTTAGPFRERPYYSDGEIEKICTEELRITGLLPSSPQPIRIDRFVEKRFKLVPKYEDVRRGVLGYTRFGKNGAEAIIVSRELSETSEPISERRLSTTIAHETGHCLLHAHLFAVPAETDFLFPADEEVESARILCRDETITGGSATSRKKYDGRWWEFQANKAIGCLLLPKQLVLASLEALIEKEGTLGLSKIPDANLRKAERLLADVFEVNPIVARIRIKELFFSQHVDQLSL